MQKVPRRISDNGGMAVSRLRAEAVRAEAEETEGTFSMTERLLEICEKCGGEMVCRCGQTASSHGWPCGHGGCLFECPKCILAAPDGAGERADAANRQNKEQG